MHLDPRTPLLVGGGQLNRREDPVEPVDMIVDAARRAAADAGAPGLLGAIDSVRIVGMLSWRYRDPGALVAERLGSAVRHTVYTGNGGSHPQALVNDAVEDVAAGRCDVVLIGGAEAWRTRSALRARGERPDWTVQGDDVVPSGARPDVPMHHPSEMRVGLDRPAYVYPLFEQALRLASGRSNADHLAAVADLWARFSDVAAGNPNAWSRTARTAAEIGTPGLGNRMISSPYPKLMNSNNAVEQAAVVVVCSVAAAERWGVPRDRWVFPQSGSEASDTGPIAARASLSGSPAIRHAGRAALDLAGVGVDDLGAIDVYSCFPSAVQVAAHELGLPLDDPARPLTVTGGLTFAGGPWNNYSTHAIATMLDAVRLRQCTGLVTANSGYLTKHSFGVYAPTPPLAGFRRADVQAAVDAEPVTDVVLEHDGPGLLESWTVVHDRDGRPETGFAAVRVADGGRTLTRTADADTAAWLLSLEAPDTKVAVRADGTFAA